MNSYSYDQQPADLKISVTLRASPDKVADLYAKFGRLDTAVNQVVSPVVNQQVKVVFGRSTAVKAIQERGALNSAIKDAITDTLKYDSMIIIESVQLEAEAAAIEAREGARHQPEPRHAGAGRALERRAADHDGAGLGGAVCVGEVSITKLGCGVPLPGRCRLLRDANHKLQLAAPSEPR